MKNIVLIGHTGQLGSAIYRHLLDKYISGQLLDENNIINKVSSKDLDITNRYSVIRYINKIKPDIIINCAAYTNVDKAEEEYEKAFHINSLGPRNLAIAAESAHAKLIHISTDYVFDGRIIMDDKVIPYREYDSPSPINVYGKTKLLGENYVREFCSKYFIIRTSWLYGLNGSNFVKKIIQMAKEKKNLQVVNDQLGNPTNVEDLSKHIIELSSTDEYGIYHCTGNGIASWYELACKIVEFSDLECKIEPVSSEQFIRKAKRPSNSSLDNMMLRSTIGDNMRNWEDALEDFIQNRMER